MTKEKHPLDLNFDPNDNPNPILRFDLKLQPLYQNTAAAPFVAYWQLGKKKSLPPSISAQCKRAIQKKSRLDMEITVQDHFYHIQICPLIEKGSLDIYAFEMTARRELQKQVFDLAYFDALTQLPNRRQLLAYLSEQIAEEQPYALLLIDIHNFKVINHVLGHRIGDELLKAVAKRLTTQLASTFFIARLSGDEFVVIDSHSKKMAEIEDLAHLIIEQLSAPFLLSEEQEVTINVSIGISMVPQDAKKSGECIRHASMALARSKKQGKSQFAFFHADMRAIATTNHQLLRDLRKALRQEELQLHYQPQFNLQTGEFVAVEALLRWKHAEQGFVDPERFTTLAEEAGLISEVGFDVLEKVCCQINEWGKRNYIPPKVAINITATQFLENHFIEKIEKITEKHGINPEQLEFELTESVLVSNMVQTKKRLKDLHDKGFKISIDDFGTGYSSLTYLKDLPVNQVKIDKSFLKDVLQSKKNQALLSHLIKLVHQLNLTVLVEGVENKKQLTFLKKSHCDNAQGYYFSEALPAESIESFLKPNPK